MVKIFITVEGGVVQNVCADSDDLDIVIVDYDDQSEEEVIIKGPFKPDFIFNSGNAAKELLPGKLDEPKKKVYKFLKNKKF